MTKFIMMVGLPGSGKSTWAEKQGMNVFSSDTMREEYYGDASFQGENNLIFELLHKKIIKSLKVGNDSIFDATNLNSKQRRHFLSKIADLDVEKIAIVVATPFEQCVENDKLRKRHVPESIIFQMQTKFQIPMLQEGFDKIDIVFDRYKDSDTYKNISIWEKAKGFDQENKHHTLDLFDHLFKTSLGVGSVSKNELLEVAGSLHDIGKLKTKTVKDNDGNAHFYNHHCISAYDSMFILKQEKYTIAEILETCQYINWHMYPYTIKFEKTRNKFINFVGQGFYDNLMILHEADKAAH